MKASAARGGNEETAALGEDVRAPLDIKIRALLDGGARPSLFFDTRGLLPAASPPEPSIWFAFASTTLSPTTQRATEGGRSVRRGMTLIGARVRGLTMRPIASVALSSLCGEVHLSPQPRPLGYPTNLSTFPLLLARSPLEPGALHHRIALLP